MSLKAFHLVFIIASTILSFGFGSWSVVAFRGGDVSGGILGLGILSIIAGVALIVYGRYFLRKLRHISYL